MTTFAQLGIPFPLFEAPVTEATDYRGVGRCALCRSAGVHCFEAGIGDHFAVPCPRCGTDTFLRADARQPGQCPACSAKAPYPKWATPDAVPICYVCLRAGKAALAKDTVFGAVWWELAVQGLTHGVPGQERDDFELVPVEDEPEWLRARIPCECLFELLRTPCYSTWQGECWDFCCREPMVYVGVWKEPDFARHAPDGDGKQLCRQIVPQGDELWGGLGQIGGPYVFRCAHCGKRAAHWDMD
jgi:uncharacterized protein CbrC (UPF0167 family)